MDIFIEFDLTNNGGFIYMKLRLALYVLSTIFFCNVAYGEPTLASLLTYGTYATGCMALKAASLLPSKSSNFFSAACCATAGAGLGFVAMKLHEFGKSDIFLRASDKTNFKQCIDNARQEMRENNWKYLRDDYALVRHYCSREGLAKFAMSGFGQDVGDKRLYVLHDLMQCQSLLQRDFQLTFVRRTLLSACALGSFFSLAPAVRYFLSLSF